MQRAPLDTDRLRATLPPRYRHVVVRAETGSTNAVLLADPDVADGTVLAAEHQLAGRGRLDRGWTSPPRAGLTFSVALRPRPVVGTWGWLPLLAGVALAEAVTDAGVAAVLKWPNDLLAAGDEGKLAGILVQSSAGVVVVGIGLNVSTRRDELPVDTATSLALCGAPDVDRTALLAGVLGRLDAWLTSWTDASGDAAAAGLGAAYRAACATLGRAVVVTTTAGGEIAGTARDVDADGRLLVGTATGRVETVAAGDVVHVRPSADGPAGASSRYR